MHPDINAPEFDGWERLDVRQIHCRTGERAYSYALRPVTGDDVRFFESAPIIEHAAFVRARIDEVKDIERNPGMSAALDD